MVGLKMSISARKLGFVNFKCPSAHRADSNDAYLVLSSKSFLIIMVRILTVILCLGSQQNQQYHIHKCRSNTRIACYGVQMTRKTALVSANHPLGWIALIL